MLCFEANNVKKYFRGRLILNIKDLKVYSDDKIGVVGLNGSGKTTLLNLISKYVEPDEGHIKTYGRISYIKQLESEEKDIVDERYISQFNLKGKNEEFMSGGELTRLKIAEALSINSNILLADEPTSNLDLEGVQMLIEKLLNYPEAIVLVSHDRNLLDIVCNKILEISNGEIKLYDGNYSDYKEQKLVERKTKEAEYEKYIKEKRKLEGAIVEVSNKSKDIKKAPKRMGNSEARLHKMGNQNAKKSLDNAVKAMETRLEKLEIKEKVKEIEKINVDMVGANEIHSKIVIEGRNINKAFGKKVIFEDGDFQIYNGSKVALIGPNGSGKTTLLKMILNKEIGIRTSSIANIGYFAQDLNILDEDKNILENVMKYSMYDEGFCRTILSRLLIKKDEVYKKVSILSGGERVKVSFAKIFLSDFNVLILDEPTNYLDIYSVEAMEEAIKEYKGTVLFVSHDKRFLEEVADTIMYIENYKIRTYNGKYNEYVNNKNELKDRKTKNIEEKKAILEYRITELLGKLSITTDPKEMKILDEEYKNILKKLKKLRN